MLERVSIVELNREISLNEQCCDMGHLLRRHHLGTLRDAVTDNSIAHRIEPHILVIKCHLVKLSPLSVLELNTFMVPFYPLAHRGGVLTLPEVLRFPDVSYRYPHGLQFLPQVAIFNSFLATFQTNFHDMATMVLHQLLRHASPVSCVLFAHEPLLPAIEEVAPLYQVPSPEEVQSALLSTKTNTAHVW